jgi:hypothetical protein
MLLLRLNYTKKALDVSEPQFQEFLKKVTKIVALFLKDDKAENEVHRAALKFLKTAVAFMSQANLQGEVADHILTQGVFSLPSQKRAKHLALLRKLVGKLLKKMGIAQLKRITPAKHHALIDYVERARRKRENKKKRAKLLALLGKPEEEEHKDSKTSAEAGDSDSDDEMDSVEDEAEERYSDDGEDDSEDESSDEEEVGGTDALMTDGLDIPRVDDIPVVSKLAKEKKLEQ